MEKAIIFSIEQHKLWVDSIGQNGEKLYLEEKLLEGGEWDNIDLSQGDIIECIFKDIILKYCDFYYARLCSSRFENVQIISGEFVRANLAYSQFINTELVNSNLSKADFSNSCLENVKIKDSKFINCLLYNVCFKNACLENIDFSGAYIENLMFDRKTVLKGIYGLDNANIKNINIGSLEQPAYLSKDEALLWLKKA